ncbi:hypothetical protein F5Y07DRAFT_399095 [Xylaria sp. FL0933]|nr:hypothetical protein F5Y07DRAFT_399095 [Xylaria sp. FL0933]
MPPTTHYRLNGFDGQGTISLAPSVNHGTRNPGSVAASQAGLDNSIRIPAPSGVPMSPIAEIRRNAIYARQKMTAPRRSENAVTVFIVPGEPKAVEGVVKAVYHDLKDGNKDASIVFPETAGYIRVETPTEEDSLALIQTSRRLAATHLSGCPDDTKLIFAEPPTTCGPNDFRISANVIGTTNWARPVVQSLPDTQHMEPGLSRNNYIQEFSKSLCEAFEIAANLNSSLILKIHLGCYLLQKYKPGDFSLKGFENMVRQPRATGQFNTRLGKGPAKLSAEATLRRIRAPDSPCLPMNPQILTSAEVAPIYILESWHDKDRYETELEKHGSIDEPLFKLARTRRFPQGAQVTRFEVISLSLGKTIDWKIVGKPGDEKQGVSPAVKQYLKRGVVELQGNGFNLYPAIRLPEASPLATKLKEVTIKTIYRFRWKQSSYVVQFMINRRWKNIRQMNTKTPPDIDFDVTIYAENWEGDSRVPAGETVGKRWGDELQGLLLDEAGDEIRCALSRVQGLVRTILDIRDFFEGVDRA